MKACFTLLLVFFLGARAFATAQYPDKLLYGGKMYAMHSNPLESYFEKYPDKRPKSEVVSTALWRGYVATFEVRDSLLYLKDIEIRVGDSVRTGVYHPTWKSVLREVFPDQQLVTVNWLTGLLVLPYGKLVNYIHMGYGSSYQKYLLLEVYAGRLKQEKRFSGKGYERFKSRQFDLFKQTEQYQQLKADLQKQGSSEAVIDSFLRNFVTQYAARILVD